MAGRSSRGRWPRSCRLPLAVAFALLASVSTASAETADEAAKRLDDCLFYARALDRGGETLVVDIEDTVAKVRRTDALDRIQADACLWRGEALLATEDQKLEERAIGYLVRVAETPENDAEFIRRAIGKLVEVHVRRGARLEATDARAALNEYDQAIRRNADDERPYKSIGGLAARVATADIAVQKYTDALETVNVNRARIAPRLGASHDTVRQLDTLVERILASSAVLELRWLGELAALRKVTGKRTEFVGGELRFAKHESGTTPMPLKLEPGIAPRLPRGLFSATAHANDGGEYRVVVDLRDERGTLTLPAALPEGMVLVPATNGLDAFLIDRTEVPRAAFRPFALANRV
jgi:hypothetical protein